MSLEKGFDVSLYSKQHDPSVAPWLQLDQTLALIWSLLSTIQIFSTVLCVFLSCPGNKISSSFRIKELPHLTFYYRLEERWSIKESFIINHADTILRCLNLVIECVGSGGRVMN